MATTEKIPQELLITPNIELIPPLPDDDGQKNPVLEMLGKVTSYATTPVITIVDAWTQDTGIAVPPESLYSPEIATLQRAVDEAASAQKELQQSTTGEYITYLSEKIVTDFLPARNKTATDKDESIRLPTEHEREVANDFAQRLSKPDSNQQAILSQLIKTCRIFNTKLVRSVIHTTFSEEETRRSGANIEALLKQSANQIELVRLPPINLLAAAVLGNPKLLPKAIAATLFTNELMVRGISVVMTFDASKKQLQLLVLTGGPGKGIEALPTNCQKEWDQPLIQEVASDTKWGKNWYRFWSKAGKFVTFRFKQAFSKENPDMVEVGTLSLINPADTTDRVDLPIIILKSMKRSPLGGSASLRQSLQIIDDANDIISQSEEIVRSRTAQSSLPAEINPHILNVSDSPNTSLARATQAGITQLMQQGDRPQVITALALEYAAEILKLNSSSERSVVVGDNHFQHILMLKIDNLTNKIRLSDNQEEQQKLDAERKDLIQQLRQLNQK